MDTHNVIGVPISVSRCVIRSNCITYETRDFSIQLRVKNIITYLCYLVMHLVYGQIALLNSLERKRCANTFV